MHRWRTESERIFTALENSFGFMYKDSFMASLEEKIRVSLIFLSK